VRLDEDGELVLRAARRGAGDVQAGDVRLHRGLVVTGNARLSVELDSGVLEERGVLLVSGQRQDEVRRHLGSAFRRVEDDGALADLDRRV